MLFALDVSQYPLNSEIVGRLLVRPLFASNSVRLLKRYLLLSFTMNVLQGDLKKSGQLFHVVSSYIAS